MVLGDFNLPNISWIPCDDSNLLDAGSIWINANATMYLRH